MVKTEKTVYEKVEREYELIMQQKEEEIGALSA